MGKLITGLLTALALLLGVGAAGSATAAQQPSTGQATGDSVIVEVEGNAADGFGIHYYDGSATYVSTDSEARAECSEYDTVRQRVRCRTEIRQWYADLKEMKRSLRWALAQ